MEQKNNTIIVTTKSKTKANNIHNERSYPNSTKQLSNHAYTILLSEEPNINDDIITIPRIHNILQIDDQKSIQ